MPVTAFIASLFYGSMLAFASVGTVAGANWLSAQPVPPQFREQWYGFWRSHGVEF